MKYFFVTCKLWPIFVVDLGDFSFFYVLDM